MPPDFLGSVAWPIRRISKPPTRSLMPPAVKNRISRPLFGPS